ncbi:hypothetical protein CEXT_129711 [Caerostris extrusa]|uniref:Uncharacterized protein n=1 Tax=Caerostris extrusa TaxID=172846 RepID=A0AAV4UFZ2_CAEEX|nr:hypothetical protein CEXT_129711 [Caerostris extrusa]
MTQISEKDIILSFCIELRLTFETEVTCSYLLFFYGVVDAHKRHPGTSLKQTKIFKAPCRFHSMATTASPVWDWGCSRKKHFPHGVRTWKGFVSFVPNRRIIGERRLCGQESQVRPRVVGNRETVAAGQPQRRNKERKTLFFFLSFTWLGLKRRQSATLKLKQVAAFKAHARFATLRKGVCLTDQKEIGTFGTDDREDCLFCPLINVILIRTGDAQTVAHRCCFSSSLL